MKNYIWLILLGLFGIVSSLGLGSYILDESNDSFWKSRSYVVLTKHPSSLVEHGRHTYVEHYISVRYEEDSKVWVREVSPAFFYSIKEEGKYTERVERDEYEMFTLKLLLSAIGSSGLIILIIGMMNWLNGRGLK